MTTPLTKATSGSMSETLKEEDEIPLIASKWFPLAVTSIEAIHVVNKKYFGDTEKVVTLTGSEMNVAGKLKECDLKLTLTLPFSVSKHHLSSLYRKRTALATEDIELTIGCHSEDTTEPKYAEPIKFSVVVPLLRGYVLRKPLLDYVDTTGHQFIHYTVEIPGIGWPTMNQFTWRIRIKVSQLEDRIECVSVSSSPLDIPRVKEATNHLSGWIKDKWNTWFPGAEQKIYQVGHQLGQAVQAVAAPLQHGFNSTPPQPEFNALSGTSSGPMYNMQPGEQYGTGRSFPIRSDSGSTGMGTSGGAPLYHETTTVTASTKYISPSY